MFKKGNKQKKAEMDSGIPLNNMPAPSSAPVLDQEMVPVIQPPEPQINLLPKNTGKKEKGKKGQPEEGAVSTGFGNFMKGIVGGGENEDIVGGGAGLLDNPDSPVANNKKGRRDTDIADSKTNKAPGGN